MLGLSYHSAPGYIIKFQFWRTQIDVFKCRGIVDQFEQFVTKRSQLRKDQIINVCFGYQLNIETERYDLLTKKNVLDFVEDFVPDFVHKQKNKSHNTV